MIEGNEISEEANNLLPEKSRKVYEKCYEKFMEWRASKNSFTLTENVLIAYFQELSTKFKSSTLWAEYSMLKSTLSIYHRTDISKYFKLVALLKRKSQGFETKKSKTFLPSEIMTFINDAPDKKYLTMKIALIFGIMGACRRQELYKLKFNDVKDFKSLILVNISDSKTKITRTFTITGKYYEKCKQYMTLRPNPCSNASFFLKYINGKCSPHNVGINKFGLMGKTIATYLGLPNPELYTGHCFRRTSATILVDAGGDITSKYRSKWTTPTVMTVQNSIQTEVPESSTAHHCIGCRKEITGFRYRCLECPGFDMCGECEGRGGHDYHYVLRVPLQRPTIEVEQVESTMRQAFSSIQSFLSRKQASSVYVAARVEPKLPLRKSPKSVKKRDKPKNFQSDTENNSSETANEPNETVKQSKETDNETKSLPETVTVKQEVVDFDEVEVKVEYIKEEMDPLEEEAESVFLENKCEQEIGEDVPLSQYSRCSPPTKKRRDVDLRSSTTDSTTAICKKEEESEEITLKETTGSETESKNIVLALKRKKTRLRNERD